MIRYRVVILLFCIFCLLVPASVAWGEGAYTAPLEQTKVPEQTTAPGNTAAPQQTAILEQTAVLQQSAALQQMAVITGDYVNVRTAADGSAAVIIRLMRGHRVTVLEVVNSWARVRMADGKEGWIYNKYITTATVKIASRGMLPSMIPEILSYAKSFLGTKYVYGGASPQGFDCSGFTLYIYNKYTFELPHEALLQSGIGEEVLAMEDLLPGDLVFFKTLGSSVVNHVGIYLGNSQFIHASSGHGNVMISPIDTGYYKDCYSGARRLGFVIPVNDPASE